MPEIRGQGPVDFEMENGKAVIPFPEVSRRIRAFKYPKVSGIVGILEGGRVPACLLAHHLIQPLWFLSINFRDETNEPRYEQPKVLGVPDNLPESGVILLVDDVSVSGKTFERAKELLPGVDIRTFALKGKADYVLFPEVKPCVLWPWKRP